MLQEWRAPFQTDLVTAFTYGPNRAGRGLGRTSKSLTDETKKSTMLSNVTKVGGGSDYAGLHTTAAGARRGAWLGLLNSPAAARRVNFSIASRV